MKHLTRLALLVALALLLPATAYGAGLAQERWLGDDAGDPRYLSTVRGVGLRFETED